MRLSTLEISEGESSLYYRNRAEITVLMCPKKLAFPVWFSNLRRYSVNIALDWVVRSAYHAGDKYDFW